VNAPAVAVNVADAAPAGTAREAGTDRDAVVEASVTAAPPAGAGEASATAHVNEAPGPAVAGVQESELMVVGETVEVFTTPPVPE